MSNEEYSKKELKKIWKKVQPSDIGEEHLRIEALVDKVQRLESYLELLIRQMNLANSRLDNIEGLDREDEERTQLMTISEKEAIKRIKKYIDEHPGCRTSDIIFNLNIEPDLVLTVLRKLENRKRIRGQEIGK
jgi:predicted transcriptional regulator